MFHGPGHTATKAPEARSGTLGPCPSLYGQEAKLVRTLRSWPPLQPSCPFGLGHLAARVSRAPHSHTPLDLPIWHGPTAWIMTILWSLLGQQEVSALVGWFYAVKEMSPSYTPFSAGPCWSPSTAGPDHKQADLPGLP